MVVQNLALRSKGACIGSCVYCADGCSVLPQLREHPRYDEIVVKMKEERIEQKNNLKSIEKATGRVVDCGDVVQLMHMRSG